MMSDLEMKSPSSPQSHSSSQRDLLGRGFLLMMSDLEMKSPSSPQSHSSSQRDLLESGTDDAKSKI
jgi:hypothetical protein